MTREECVFTKGATEKQKSRRSAQQSEEEATRAVESTPDEDWQRARELLAAVSHTLSRGMGPEIVREQTLAWCDTQPNRIHPETGAWTCVLERPPVLGDREFVLEYGGGVVSLTAFDLPDTASHALISQVRRRWGKWCRRERFSSVEGQATEEFLQCELREGPILVVGRFLRDIDYDLWQVSLSISP